MATKDPHIAYIDAHEELEAIKLKVRASIELAKRKAGLGGLTADDQIMIKAIHAEAVEAAKRVQDKLYEELKHA